MIHDTGKNVHVPGFIFLVHGVDVGSTLHVPYFSRTFASLPYVWKPILLPLWPAAFITILFVWAFSKTFLFSFYKLRGRLHQIWIVPRVGFQVGIGFQKIFEYPQKVKFSEFPCSLPAIYSTFFPSPRAE